MIDNKFREKMSKLKIISTLAIEKSISSILQKCIIILGLTRLYLKKIPELYKNNYPSNFKLEVKYIQTQKVYDINIDNLDFSFFHKYLNLLIINYSKLLFLENILLKQLNRTNFINRLLKDIIFTKNNEAALVIYKIHL